MKDTMQLSAPGAGRGFYIGRLRLPALALLSFAYVFGSTWLFTVRYGVNDNGGVLEYAQLGLTSLAMDIPLVKLLHLGYTLVPGLPWYGLCYYLFHTLSVFVWLWSFSRVFRPWWVAGIFSVAFLGYYLPFLLYLDYTDTAMMLCAASLGWIFIEVMEERSGYRRFLAPGLMFTFGAMARPEVPLGSLAYAFFMALLVVFWRLRARPYAKEISRLTLIAAIFFTPLILDLAGDAAYRQYAETPQELQYYRLDSAREALEKHTTRPRKQMIMRDDVLLASLGWTRLDAEHIFNWNYLDERKFTVQALRMLLDKAPPRQVSFGDFADAVEGHFTINPYTLPLLGAALIALVIVWRRRWLGLLALSAPLYCIVFSSFMAVFFLYDDRTRLPLVMGCGFMTLLICHHVAAAATRGLDKMLMPVALVAALLTCFGAYTILGAEAAMRSTINTAINASQERLEVLNRDYAGQIILMDPNGAMPIFKLGPLRNHPVDFQPIELGWNTFSPLFYDQIGKLGIQHGYELVDALITHHAYALGRPNWCQNLQDYVSPPLKPHLKVTLIRKFYDDYNLYQFGEEPAHK